MLNYCLTVYQKYLNTTFRLVIEQILIIKLKNMRIILKITKLAMIAFLVLGVSSCSDDDDDGTEIPATLNIVELAIADVDNLSSLVAALTAADTQEGVDLIATLSGTTNYTVLAPTNEAFQKFLDDNGFADLAAVPLDVLTMVLKNHVIKGALKKMDLEANGGTGYTTTLADAGPDGNLLSLYYNTTDGVEFNGVSSVTTADVNATNGVIHMVDAVIGLPDVTTFATADPDFSGLVEGLTAYSFDYVNTLQGEGPFTVFIPNNTAFDTLLGTNDDWNTLGDIDEATLASALTLHVIAGSNVRAADLTDGEVTTLGGDVMVDATAATITDGSDPAVVSTIAATDVQATNGVIHVIDTVLLTPIQ